MAEDNPPRQSPAYLKIDPVKLQALRQQHAFKTQVQLARMTGLSRATISLLETGRRGASPDTLRRLCEALECEPGQILTQEGNTDNATQAPDGSG